MKLKGRLHIGVFESGESLLSAARETGRLGSLEAEAFTPCPVHGLDAALGIRRSRLPFVTLIGGAVGLTLALWFQYWASGSDWPLDVGGKPFDSLPAFMPIGFEMLVLLGGLATAGALLFRSGLRPGAPAARIGGCVSDDRFVLVLACRDASLTEQHVMELLAAHGALETWSEYAP